MTSDWDQFARRWESFQDAYVPDRRGQFRAVLEYVADSLGRPPGQVLDLGCGPGSLARAARTAFPGAAVTALDADPFLLELGMRSKADPEVRWVHADLRDPAWPDAVCGARPFDAVVSATATHWLDPGVLGGVYRQVHALLRKDGVLVNADLIPPGGPGSRLGRVALERTFRAQPDRSGATDQTWRRFWRDAERRPTFVDLMAQRQASLGDRPPRVFLGADQHRALLGEAGFADVVEVWRRDAWAVVVARA